MVVRREGEYAIVRPGREMLYTVVSPVQKYMAKNFIDTVVYRGGDALSAWVKRGLDPLAEHPAAAIFIRAGIAVGWAARRHAGSGAPAPGAQGRLGSG